MVMLRVRDSQGNTVQEHNLRDGAYPLGHGAENAIVLKDSTVSEHHAEIIVQGDSCLVRRLESAGEVLVNGRAITEVGLRPKDIVVVGSTHLELLWDEGQGTKIEEDQVGQLEVIYPKEMSGILFLEKERMIMGRVPECDIQIHDKQASRHHAKLIRQNHVYVLEDQNSANGTVVNGKKISSHPLSQGDVIQIGALQYRYSVCQSKTADALKRTAEISQVAVIAAAKKQQHEEIAEKSVVGLAIGAVVVLAFVVYLLLPRLTVVQHNSSADQPLTKTVPVTATRLVKKSNNMPAILKQALVTSQNKTHLYAIVETIEQQGKTFGKAAKIEVKTGVADGPLYELDTTILEKIGWQTYIVTEGQLNLADGTLAEIVAVTETASEH